MTNLVQLVGCSLTRPHDPMPHRWSSGTATHKATASFSSHAVMLLLLAKEGTPALARAPGRRGGDKSTGHFRRKPQPAAQAVHSSGAYVLSNLGGPGSKCMCTPAQAPLSIMQVGWGIAGGGRGGEGGESRGGGAGRGRGASMGGG